MKIIQHQKYARQRARIFKIYVKPILRLLLQNGKQVIQSFIRLGLSQTMRKCRERV